MDKKPDCLLVLAPHTDDAELGCGGTMARFIEEGVRIHVVAFSKARRSLPPGQPPDVLEREMHESTRRLGIPAECSVVLDYPVRKFEYARQEILEQIVQLRKDIDPQTVFLPSGNDLHQDHQVIHAEGMRAFKDLTVWGYELPWNHVHFSAEAFVVLKQRHVDQKLEALSAYESQLALGRPYFQPDFIRGLARTRGVQVKAEYAEAFEVIRVRVS